MVQRPGMSIGWPSARQGAVGGVGGQVVGIDLAVAEVADEQVAGQAAERRGGDRQPPGRVQPRARRRARASFHWFEDVDEAVAGPDHVVVLGRVLQGVRDVELATEKLDVERREPGRDTGIAEGPREVWFSGARLDDVDRIVAEVRGEEVRVGPDGGLGDALVDIRRRAGDERLGRLSRAPSPAGDGPVFADEEEVVAVKDGGFRRRSCSPGPSGCRGRPGDGHDQADRRDRPRRIDRVERCQPGGIVRHPERAAGENETPQGFVRLGSVTWATPGRSATRLTWLKGSEPPSTVAVAQQNDRQGGDANAESHDLRLHSARSRVRSHGPSRSGLSPGPHPLGPRLAQYRARKQYPELARRLRDSWMSRQRGSQPPPMGSLRQWTGTNRPMTGRSISSAIVRSSLRPRWPGRTACSRSAATCPYPGCSKPIETGSSPGTRRAGRSSGGAPTLGSSWNRPG